MSAHLKHLDSATFPALVEQQADRTPEAFALVAAERRWTYRELQDRIVRLAQVLHAHGIEHGERVGLLVQRGEDTMDLIAALLAIMWIGAVYVPLSTELPSERFSLIMRDAAISTVLGFHSHTWPFTQTAAWQQIRSLSLEDLDEGLVQVRPETLPSSARPGDLAYILYTTGTSAGRPKGVMVEHRALAHYAAAQNAALGIRPGDRATQGFALSFDASLSDLTMLAAGACLYPFSAEACLGGRALSDFLATQAITVAAGVPSLIQTLPDRPLPESLRLLIVGGEVCPPALVERFWQPNVRVINAYGLTETTVCCSMGECYPGQPITIGKPLTGVTVSIRDKHLHPVPAGTPGRICVSGLCLARGYTDPLLTTQCFLSDPCDASVTLFATEDEGRWENGTLIFLGRLDASRRRKRQGKMIDLDEIEAVLLRAPGLLEGAVEEVKGRIVAYIACIAPPMEASETWEARVRRVITASLGDVLLPYMLPQAYVFVPRLPRTSSDKLDRQALRALPISWSPSHVNQAQGHIAQGVAEIVARLLTRQMQQLALMKCLAGLEETQDSPPAPLHWQQIDLARSAAELGLESLDAPDLAQRVLERFGVPIAAQQVYVPLHQVASAIEEALAESKKGL